MALSAVEDFEQQRNEILIETDGEPQKQMTFAATFVLGGMASITAECCTYPLDVLKTRLQVTKHLSPFEVTKTLFLKEGASKIMLGLEAACLRHIFYGGIRIMLYEYLRDHSPIGRNKVDGTFPMYQSALCALLAGGIGQFIASPTDFAKVQMQVEGLRLIQGQPRLYQGTFDCFRSLYTNYGFFGLWRGCVPNVQRGAIIQIGGLCGYDKTKRGLMRTFGLKDDWILHGYCSIIAGLIQSLMCTPCDGVKTRMMNEPTLYRGTFHCFGSIIKNEGVKGLYRGFFPIWARLGPWTTIFYLTFEKLRTLNGLDGF